ncbi:MAG: hypothetical protein AAFY20_07450 [Cyanobacteria bacterium J06639_14]
MTSTSLNSPAIALAGDLGTSASKFFYRQASGTVQPLWMGAEVADNLTVTALPSLNAGGRPQDSAWLQLGDEVVLVGPAAKAFLETNSLTANKADKAAYKVLAALGAIAELENLPSSYSATVWIALPLTEIRTREAIAAKLSALGQKGFRFRGKSQQVNLSLKFFPEAFGLYLSRKKQLDNLGYNIEQRRTLIVMMGHRNLSLLCFEGGSLKMAHSNSDGPGFWPAFEKATRALGVTPTDYPAVLSALTTETMQQISQSRAGRYDFSEIVQAVQQTYWSAVKIYLQDNLLSQLSESDVDIVLSGGAAYGLRSQLKAYFQDLGLTERINFAHDLQPALTSITHPLPEASTQAALPLRMADCYGLFQGLLGKLNPVPA